MGSDDPQAQAEAILAESDRRKRPTGGRPDTVPGAEAPATSRPISTATPMAPHDGPPPTGPPRATARPATGPSIDSMSPKWRAPARLIPHYRHH